MPNAPRKCRGMTGTVGSLPRIDRPAPGEPRLRYSGGMIAPVCYNFTLKLLEIFFLLIDIFVLLL